MDPLRTRPGLDPTRHGVFFQLYVYTSLSLREEVLPRLREITGGAKSESTVYARR